MTSNFSGITKYQQTGQLYQGNQVNKGEKVSSENESILKKADMKTSEWKGASVKNALIPTTKEGYGTVIGDVELSDKAKEYYDKLKSKYHGMDFILVSKDMKSQVAAKASMFGNASKPIVLIDDEKLEKMANDENFRKKYEAIIESSITRLQEAKMGLASTGASIRNFGMSVNSDGNTSFFVTLEKLSETQNKMIAKKREAKKEAELKEKKEAKKEEEEARIEKQKSRKTIDFKADSIEELLGMVSKYAFENSSNTVLSKEETMIGQSIDFKG